MTFAAMADAQAASYGIASSDYTKSYTSDAFVATARAQSAVVGTIVALRRRSDGGVQTSPLGFSYVVLTYEVDRSIAGVVTTTTDDVYFVLENGAWRLWFSATR